MSYIYMDESGDLGFSKKSSKWFLFSLVVVEDNKILDRLIKKVWKGLRKKHKHIGELHASREKVSTIIKILENISKEKELKIITAVLNKQKVYIDHKNQKHYLYNYVANSIWVNYMKNKLL